MEYASKSDEWKNLTPAERAKRRHLMAEGTPSPRERPPAGDPPPAAEPGRPRLKTIDARAIAEFLNGGGTIAKVKQPVTATEQEVIDFLATCGVAVRYSPGDMKAYWCNNRRCSMTALVRLANGYRYAQQLAPFEMRLPPSRK